MAEPSLFPHRRTCEWIELAQGLRARTCEDGETLWFYDTETRETWSPSDTPPKKWRRFLSARLSGSLGAAATDGMCPPHPSIRPRPMAKIVRLQKALNALARRTGDHAVGTTVDGLTGAHTVKVVNRAMYMYAKGAAPSDFTTGRLTHAQVVAFSPQLAAYVERAPIAAATRIDPATSPSLPTPPSSPQISPSTQVPVQYLPPSGGNMDPYYQQPYYPPPVYYSNRAPGGLPADQASVDVKAFIPAQYEHVQVDPTTVMAAIIVGVGIYIVWSKKKKEG